ncbi:hypothetical protein KIP00_21910 [Vibrio sp. B513a]|uniref:hypothetical protein n=1 Tax=Vibrio sp. B513a TaxID=2836183 RepID=UPI0025534C67|nr:hypothetical protein [Vibrio sp. B513a]MDK9753685.1 hypothetical protein [Vibrio sp. B513a]
MLKKSNTRLNSSHLIKASMQIRRLPKQDVILKLGLLHTLTLFVIATFIPAPKLLSWGMFTYVACNGLVVYSLFSLSKLRREADGLLNEKLLVALKEIDRKCQSSTDKVWVTTIFEFNEDILEYFCPRYTEAKQNDSFNHKFIVESIDVFSIFLCEGLIEVNSYSIESFSNYNPNVRIAVSSRGKEKIELFHSTLDSHEKLNCKAMFAFMIAIFTLLSFVVYQLVALN